MDYIPHIFILFMYPTKYCLNDLDRSQYVGKERALVLSKEFRSYGDDLEILSILWICSFNLNPHRKLESITGLINVPLLQYMNSKRE